MSGRSAAFALRAKSRAQAIEAERMTRRVKLRHAANAAKEKRA
jgi:hypothetical protein